MSDTYPLPSWPRALGEPLAKAGIRSQPADFRVVEQLRFEPSGTGEHAFLRLRKCGLTSERVARALAGHAGVAPLAVGYAGMKDKHADTEQWFSIHLPGRSDPDWAALELPGCEVVAVTRHHRKLKRGALRGNAFQVILRDVTDGGDLRRRWEHVAGHGVPNYFGPQRFGYGSSNVTAARQMLADSGPRDRFKRGLYISAARAWLFNQVLARRIGDRTWDKCLPGELLQLDGSHSVFNAAQSTLAIERRLRDCDIHPTGPLWGAGDGGVGGQVLALERAVAESEPALCAALTAAGASPQRRSLRAPLRDAALEWIAPAHAVLWFTLPAGSYATSVVRELVAPQAPWDEI